MPGSGKIPWLIDPNAARVSVLLVSVWLAVPFMTVSASGIMRSLPAGIFEAARLDGAGPVRSFVSLTLPLVARRMTPILVLGFTASFNNFTAIYLLTSGGPAYPGAIGGAGATDIIISYIFKLTLMSRRYGLAAAYAVVVFAALGARDDHRHAQAPQATGGGLLVQAREIIRKLGGSGAGLFVSALALVSAAPIIFIVSVSFSSGGELYAGNLLPHGFTLDNYRTLFFGTDFFLWVGNSMLVATSTALIAVTITSMAAWTLSRYRFAGSSAIASGLLLVQLFPGVMSLVAIFKILQFLRILDTHGALILVYLGGAIPFATWILKGFFDTIPPSLEQAAYLDGAGPLTVYLSIVLPVSLPMLSVVFAFTFIAAYSDFLLAAVVLTDERLYTLALGLRTFLEGDFSTNWSVFSAAALLGSLPIIGMFGVVMLAGGKSASMINGEP